VWHNSFLTFAIAEEGSILFTGSGKNGIAGCVTHLCGWNIWEQAMSPGYQLFGQNSIAQSPQLRAYSYPSVQVCDATKIT